MAKTKKTWLFLSVAALIAAGAASALLYPRYSAHEETASAAPVVPDKPSGVGARGRIEPEDGVITVAAPYLNGQPSLVSELRVREGDRVTAGQVIAVLDGWPSLDKALRQSEADAEVARKRLAQTQAGSKIPDIDAQKMEIARWESEYEISKSDYRRFETLHQNQIATTADLDQKRLAMERAQRTLDGAKEHLKSLEEIRREDVDVGAAQVASALAQVEHARAELDRMIVRAPAAGRVLKIRARVGEQAGVQGILELGKTDRMYVIAEVYESDINRVRPGQKAIVSGDLLPEKLSGEVTQIEAQVTKSEMLPLEPAAFADVRVVKVKIRLDTAEAAAHLIYGKVDVVIQP
jgi:HlyD family secretion protein